MRVVFFCIGTVLLSLTLSLPLSFDGRSDPRYLSCLASFTPPTTDSCDINWAVSATNVLAHRFCIQLDESVELEGRYVAGCQPRVGCDEEFPDSAWNFLNSVGAPTRKCYRGEDRNSTCPLDCSDHSPMTFYSSSKATWLNSKLSIQLSIMMKGPVQSCFRLYSDFLNYTNGIYHHNISNLNFVKRECVEVVGWGVDGGREYWIGVGTRGETWGINGYFYYEMGQVGGIESEVVAAEPDEIYT